MKTGEQIAQEIEKHKSIDKIDGMYDETWEDYMRGRKMARIKLDLLYYESKVVCALSKLFANIAYKFMDKHHEIYLKHHKLSKEVKNEYRDQ